MARVRAKLRRRLLLLAYTLGIALGMLLLPARLTAPARIVFTQALGPAEQLLFNAAGDAAAGAGTLRDALLASERSRALEQQVRRLRNERLVLREMLLDRQRRIESFERLRLAGARFRALSTQVTAYDARPMRRSICIAAGSRDGVRAGLAVCSAGAVVGQVVEVGPWYSRVRLITDAGSALPCRVQRTRELCILQGTGGVNCAVQWLSRDAQVRAGDVLVSAPMDRLLSARPLVPPGLPVAEVTLAEPGRDNPLFKHVRAAPLVNLRRLEAVEVVMPVEARSE